MSVKKYRKLLRSIKKKASPCKECLAYEEDDLGEWCRQKSLKKGFDLNIVNMKGISKMVCPLKLGWKIKYVKSGYIVAPSLMRNGKWRKRKNGK